MCSAVRRGNVDRRRERPCRSNEEAGQHERMQALPDGADDQFVITGYVVAEVAYLAQKFASRQPKSSSQRRSGTALSTNEELGGEDLDRVVELTRRFQDFPVGAADASITAVAERLKIAEVATIDGHFRAVQPAWDRLLYIIATGND